MPSVGGGPPCLSASAWSQLQPTASRIEQLAPALGSADATVDGAIAAICRINAAIGLPASLAEVGITPDQLPRIAELGMASARLAAISPVPASRDLLLGILERAHAGALAAPASR